jgi:hypothetical protein
MHSAVLSKVKRLMLYGERLMSNENVDNERIQNL